MSDTETLTGLHMGGAWMVTAPVEMSHRAGSPVVIDCAEEE